MIEWAPQGKIYRNNLFAGAIVSLVEDWYLMTYYRVAFSRRVFLSISGGHNERDVRRGAEISRLSRPSIFPWALAAAAEWAAIVILFALRLVVKSPVVWVFVTIMLGSRQHALGALGYGAAHFTAAQSRKLNDIAGELVCFWPLLTGLHDFRAFHLDHHRFFNTDKDPELLFKNRWSVSQWALPKSRNQILVLFLGDLVGFGVLEVMKAFYLLGRTRPRSIVGPSLWWLVVGGVMWMAGLQVVLVIWFVAFLTSFWGFFRLRAWTEHVGAESTHAIEVNWWQKLLVTPHCSWTHAEHHDHPSVPFWRRRPLRDKTLVAIPFLTFLASFDDPKSTSDTAPEIERGRPVSP
jgi:fatty acid desaturase